MTKFKRNNISDKTIPIRTRDNLPAKTNKPKAKNGNGRNGIMTSKKKKFVNEYLVDLNGLRAAIRAGYSEKGAGVIACNLLKDIKVQEAIAKRQLELQKSTDWTPERVLNIYKKLTDYSLEDVYDDEHKLKPVSEMSENARYAVYGIKSIKKTTKKTFATGAKSESETIMSDLKFTPKKDILDKVGEHLGMFASPDDTPRGGISIDKAVINIKFVD